jgi:hypothetical protein
MSNCSCASRVPLLKRLLCSLTLRVLERSCSSCLTSLSSCSGCRWVLEIFTAKSGAHPIIAKTPDTVPVGPPLKPATTFTSFTHDAPDMASPAASCIVSRVGAGNTKTRCRLSQCPNEDAQGYEWERRRSEDKVLS